MSDDQAAVLRRSDGISNHTLPVKIAIDSSADGRRAAYVALIVDHGVKPRLIYGVGSCVSTSLVESWGMARAIRRVNGMYNGRRPLIVYTDNLALARSRGTVHVQYRWLSREDRLMHHLHAAVNALRRSL